LPRDASVTESFRQLLTLGLVAISDPGDDLVVSVQEHGGGLLVLVEELGQALGDEVPADGAARCARRAAASIASQRAAVRIAARREDAGRAEIAARIRLSSSDATGYGIACSGSLTQMGTKPPTLKPSDHSR